MSSISRSRAFLPLLPIARGASKPNERYSFLALSFEGSQDNRQYVINLSLSAHEKCVIVF